MDAIARLEKKYPTYNPINGSSMLDEGKSDSDIQKIMSLLVFFKGIYQNGIAKREHDGRPVLCFMPGICKEYLNSERMGVASEASDRFPATVGELQACLNNGSIKLPPHQYRTVLVGPSWRIRPIRFRAAQ